MNARIQKLLSWLIVAAMVISMVPVFDLPVFAAETASDEIVYGSANIPEDVQAQMQAGNSLDDSDAAIDGYIAAKTCPMCGASDVEWIHGTNVVPTINKSTDTANTDGTTYHYYFDSTIEHPNNFVGMLGKNGVICVALKSTADITCQKYRVMMGGSGNTLNIMGTGKLVADQKDNASTDGDLGLLQVASGTVNLYGGKFQHKQFAYNGTPDYRKAVIRIAGASAVVNIFDGVVIGPDEVDQTTVAQNVHFAEKGVVNMFGGTIQNGVSPDWGYSGNVTIAMEGTFNLYGGTIKNGTFKSVTVDGTTTAAAHMGGNVMVGGIERASRESSTDYATTKGKFNMYGGTISGGKANNGGNGGGNLYINATGTANLLGGTVSGGYAKASGGNIQVAAGTVNIGGSLLIENGEAKSKGGNIYLTGGTLNITDGKILGGEATNGGSIAQTGGTLNISGGIIDGGHASSNGGNIYTEKTTMSITGGIIQNGVAENQGGNLNVAANTTIEGGQILNGTSRKGGGNINIGSQGLTLTVKGGTIAGGWVSGPWSEEDQAYKPTGAHWGGNIRGWGDTIEIAGGLIYGGARGPAKSGHACNNIGCLASLESSSTNPVNPATLILSGGTVIGDISTSGPSQNEDGSLTCTGTAVIFKGAPTVVNRYHLEDGTMLKATYTTINLGNPANIDELLPEAHIMLSVGLNKVLTQPSDNAEAVAGCLVPADKRFAALVNENKELVVSWAPFVEPERPTAELGGSNISDEAWAEIVKAAEIQHAMTQLDPTTATYCPMCGAENITWTDASSSTFNQTPTADAHYYVSKDMSNTKYNWIQTNAAGVDICLALVGDPTLNLGGLLRAGNSSDGCVINVGGNGTLIGSGAKAEDLGMVLIQGKNNTLNLYGGTYIYTGDGHNVKANQITGEKDADGKYTVKGDVEFANSAALTLKGGNNTANIFSGVVIGPEKAPETQTYNVRVEVNTVSTTNTLNMYGGTIRNGVSGIDNLNGYSIYRWASGNVTLNAQSSAKASINGSVVFNMYGGEIVGGTFEEGIGNHAGGNIAAVAKGGATVNIYGGSVKDGSAPNNGGNIYVYGATSALNMYGGTISGGRGYNGGNIYSNGSPVYLGEYALIENGYATIESDGGGGNIRTTGALTTYGVIRNGESRAFGGNVIVEGVNNTHTIAGGEIYGGKSDGQGGNVRCWATNVNMTGGKIYDGEQYGSTDKNHNVWIVSSDWTMTGGEIERCENAGLRTSYYMSGSWSSLDEAVAEERASCTVTLGGDAKVGYLHVNEKNELHIDNGWTGEATLSALNGQTYTIGDVVESEKHICGSEVDGVFTKGGSYSGKLYYEPCYGAEILGVDGALTLASKAAILTVGEEETTATWYDTNEEAAAAYEYSDTSWLMLTSGEVTLPETINEVNLQLAGSNVTLYGNALVTGADVTNNGYTRYGTLTAGEGIQVAPEATYNEAYRYIALNIDGEWSFHRVVIDLTHVTLRTGDKPGMYYKASYKCDEVLADRIDSYGVVLSLQDMPNTEFMYESGNAWTKYDINDFKANYASNTVSTTSGSVVNIIKESLSKEENTARMQMKVYANAYMTVDTTGMGELTNFMSDNANGGKTAEAEDFTGVAYSLFDIVKAINDNWDTYSDEDKAIVAENVAVWAGWIANAEEFAAELGNIVAYEPPVAA